MRNVNKVGKAVGDTHTSATFNIQRIAEKFPKIDRAVDNVNKLRPYFASFKTSANMVYLNLRITEVPTPCTINPPITNIGCVGVLHGQNPGAITYFNSNTGGFTLTPDGMIVVPVSGCYTAYFVSYAAGYTQMFGGAYAAVAIFHNYEVVRELLAPAQGVWNFGGGVWTYAPPSPVYVYIAANAGDTVGCGLSETITSYVGDWFGPRDFSLWLNPDGTTTLELTLIASAEM